MTTVEGRTFILLSNGALEQIADGAKIPKGYIGAYGLKSLIGVFYFLHSDGKFHPRQADYNFPGQEKSLKLEFEDCVYVPFEQQHF